MSSAISFNLDQSKICSSGNGLNVRIVWYGNLSKAPSVNTPLSPFCSGELYLLRQIVESGESPLAKTYRQTSPSSINPFPNKPCFYLSALLVF